MFRDRSYAYLPTRFNPLERKASGPLFIYIPVDKRSLAAKQRQIVKELNLPGIKPTDLSHFHITLVFVENCSDSTITQVLESFRPPTKVGFEVTSVEVLDGGEEPALVLLVNPDPGLVRLQSDLYYALLDHVSGMSEYSDPKVWKAHITIAHDLPTVPAYVPEMQPFKLTADRFVVGRDEFRDIATVKLDGGVSLSKGFVEKLYSTELDESSLYTILRGEQAVVGPLRRVLDLKDGPYRVADKENVVKVRSVDKLYVVNRGGEGSGNFGHAGRPGEVGGSQAKEGIGTTRIFTDTEGGKHEVPEFSDNQIGQIEQMLRDKYGLWPASNTGSESRSNFFITPSGQTTVNLPGHPDAHRELEVLFPETEGRPHGTMLVNGFIRGNIGRNAATGQKSISIDLVADSIGRLQRDAIEDIWASGHYSNGKYTGEPEIFYDVLMPDGSHLISTDNRSLERALKITLEFKSIVMRGGEGSGNFGHAGRPGEVGGSAPGNGGVKAEGGAKIYAAGFNVLDANKTYAAARKVLSRIENDTPSKSAWVSPTGEAYHAEDGHNIAADSVIQTLVREGDGSVFSGETIEDPEELFMMLGWMRVAGNLPGGLGLQWQEDLTESQKEVATRIVINAERTGREIDWESRNGTGNIEALKDEVLGFKSLTMRGGPGSGHFTHDGRPGTIGGSTPGEGGPASWNEAAERAAVMGAIRGQITELKPGTTREQGQRFHDRRNAVNAADRFHYRDGNTARQVIDSKLMEGPATIRRERFYYEVTNRESGQSMRFTRSEERDYIDTLMSHGRFARNYELVERGGPGSGHFGHAGRPGEVGGSEPGDGAAIEAGFAKSSEPVEIYNLEKENSWSLWLTPSGLLYGGSKQMGHLTLADKAVENAGLTDKLKAHMDAGSDIWVSAMNVVFESGAVRMVFTTNHPERGQSGAIIVSSKNPQFTMGQESSLREIFDLYPEDDYETMWSIYSPDTEEDRAHGSTRAGLASRFGMTLRGGPVIDDVRRHLGPGPHPSGSEQQVHAGGGGGEKKNGAKAGKQIYHGTGARAARNIMKSGLQVSHSDSDNIKAGVIFAAGDYETARSFATRRSATYAVITIDPSLAGSKPQKGPIGGELMFGSDIPSTAIVKVDIYRRGERRADDRLVETIERTFTKSMVFAAASIEDNDEFVLMGPTIEDLEKRHLGPGPHPSGTEQAVHAGGDGSAKKEGEKKGKVVDGSVPKEKGTRSPEALSRASALFTAATEAEPRLTPMMESVARATGGELHGLQYSVKTEEALANKIDRDAAENGQSHEESAQAITDANRYTMTFESDDYVDGVLKAQAELETKGYSQYDEKWRNYFVSGDPYDGYNSVYINHETGERFEVQFHTPDTLMIKNEVHGLYKEFQASPEGSPERLVLWERMGEAWEGYEKPPGWETLPGRATVEVTE